MHPLYDVTGFEMVADYTLRVHFDDGSTQTINFEPVLHGELYGPLRDLRLFRQVRLDPEVATLVWPNGADFDPYTLHEWTRLAEQLVQQSQAWALELA
jgi:Protein of unknown function (DUF2442)